MIEKLPFEITQGEYEGKKFDIKSHTSPFDMQVKINELVDAVNEFEKDREEIKEWIAIVSDLRSRVPVVESRVSILEEHLHPTAKTDPYAEQRKWIGKLCQFRDNYSDKWNYGILKSINNIECSFPFKDMEDYEWAICEPVKPDDDIIFKGE